MFKCLAGAGDARRALLSKCNPVQQSEELQLNATVGRILSRYILSYIDLPAFNRAAMDGFAVNSTDTRGAKPHAPVQIDNFFSIRTGMVVPGVYDAIVMLEDAILHDHFIEVMAEAYPYKNISRIGEDVRRGDNVMKVDHKLRPPDITLLAALGVKKVEVYIRPKVAILPTGAELVPIGARSLQPGEAYEINGLMAKLYVEMWGGEAFLNNIISDDLAQIKRAIESYKKMDMIIIIGGTSVGERDYAPRALEELGSLLVHGIRIQPGKPTALGTICGKPVICLPGYPVATLASLYLFVRPALKKMARMEDKVSIIRAKLTRKVASKAGYLSIVRVALEGDRAIPIMVSGAGILSSVAKADGFVLIPEEQEGLNAGEPVEVNLFE
ncbi:MAG: molybdopterin molybdotransferase MoeA [Methanotrichaceae archaeon]|nr:molybdopterin molybdotransferase MoeA [Methanotrichaceae archaeon]